MGANEVTGHMLATYEAGEMITICAWCKRVEIDGEWLLTPRATLTAVDARHTVTHSICPACSVPGAAPPVAS